MCNSFVIGDLVIDHAISVAETTPNHQQIKNERIFKVLRRTDMAGGAANCARILASLSAGQTFLWGLVGSSHWGSFRKILEHSQDIDGSSLHNKIEFRGASDDTNAQMNTVTRLIIEKDKDGNAVIDFGHRFDESGHLHVPADKRSSLRYYLDRCLGKKEHLDVIVINDLDMGCLTKELVGEIAKFASEHHIPLFVDPKYNVDKYRDIKGTAILPNLAEWCRLVGQDHERWANAINDSKADLSEMAYHSLKCFNGFDYCIIKCDRNGIIFIGPSVHVHHNDCCMIYKMPPWRVISREQLGCGDMMTAVFAMEFVKLADPRKVIAPDQRSLVALKALIAADAAVSCYIDMPWHRLPTRESIAKMQDEVWRSGRFADLGTASDSRVVGTPRKGIRFFPTQDAIDLADYRTAVHDWFSCDATFREFLEKLAAELQTDIQDWSDGNPVHIFLTGPSGTGKTDVMKKLAEELDLDLTIIDKPTPDAKRAQDETLRELEKALNFQGHRKIVMIDEALKRGFGNLSMTLNCLQMASQKHARLVLADTGFLTTGFFESEVNREVVRRGTIHVVPGIIERPWDIPFVIAGLIFKNAPQLESIDVSGEFLLAFINNFLKDPTIGSKQAEIKRVLELASKQKHSGRSLVLSGKHLSKSLALYVDASEVKLVHQVRFVRSKQRSQPKLVGVSVSKMKIQSRQPDRAMVLVTKSD